jgi:aminoglycoside 6-adenylyltransferase
MDQTGAVYEQLLEKIVAWAGAEEAVRSAIVIGSRARSENPADEASDLDIILLVTDTQPYLASAAWLEEIGQPRLTFIEPTGDGRFLERRVLFEGGYDVDFAFLPVEAIRQILEKGFPPDIALILKRGARIVLDKDGLAAQFQQAAPEPTPARPPAQSEFLNLVNDFWYHSVWTAKKLLRGELWTAKMCSDNYMKWRLLRMIEWHACAGHGWDYDTWHGGRFLEKWVDPEIIEALQPAFAAYSAEDLWRGLFATMDLFRRLATETAGRLAYPYPASGDACAAEIVEKIYEKEGSPCKASS